MDTDPGPEFRARQHDQLVVINAMEAAVQANPDRFTGLVPNGSGEVTVRLVDPAAADEPAFAALLADAAAAGIAVTISPAPRPLAVLRHVMAEATRTIGHGDRSTPVRNGGSTPRRRPSACGWRRPTPRRREPPWAGTGTRWSSRRCRSRRA